MSAGTWLSAPCGAGLGKLRDAGLNAPGESPARRAGGTRTRRTTGATDVVQEDMAATLAYLRNVLGPRIEKAVYEVVEP
jgi:hypothetical protein